MALSKKAIKSVHDIIDQLFDSLKYRFLGPTKVGKKMEIRFEPKFSLPGMFESAAELEGTKPDQSILDSLMGVAESYLEAYRHTAKAKVVNEVQSFLAEVKSQKAKTNVYAALENKLKDAMEGITSSVQTVVDSEVQRAKNVSGLETIVKINNYLGVDDPKVFFVVVRDEHTCDECKRLHLLENLVTPRVWLMSELSHGYHKKGEDFPSVAGAHCRCRCSLQSLPPGWGFDAGGRVKYINPDHDELAVQRNVQKSEIEYIPHECDLDSLEKALPEQTHAEFTRNILRPWGWTDPEGGEEKLKHFGSKHTKSGLTWKGFSHSDKSGKISSQRQEHFLSQLGLKHVSVGDKWKIGYQPGTPHEAGYKALGLPSIDEAKVQLNKEREFRQALGANSNPMVIAGVNIPPEHYRLTQAIGHGVSDEEINSPNFQHRASQVKPDYLPVMNVDGRLVAAENDELLHHAKKMGYTHIPVRIID